MMKNDRSPEEIDRKDSGIGELNRNTNFWESSAAITSVVAVTVFLCLFTVFEVIAAKQGWNFGRTESFIGMNSGEVQTESGIESENAEVSDKADERAEQIQETEICIETDGNTETVNDTEAGNKDTEICSEEENTEEEEVFPYYIKINRQQNVVTVHEKDSEGEYTQPIRAMVCSAGANNATPKGVFHISDKYDWRVLYGGVYGQYACRITGGVLFHSVPYVRRNKSTLYWEKYNKLGQHASIGCVRLTVEDAKWIYDNCPSGTTVEVYESDEPGPLGKPEILKLDKDNANKGWDPTDPDENNPWHLWSEDE